MQSANVLRPNPYPHARLALIVVGEKDRASVARDAGKSITGTPSQFEAKSVHIMSEAGSHVLDPKDGVGGPKLFVDGSGTLSS